MNAPNMNRVSRTDWARIDAMTDAQIDTTDIPPLDEAFFARATLRLPTARRGAKTVGVQDTAGRAPLPPAEMATFFHTLGVAMFQAQGLEYSLVSLYAAVQIASGSPRGSDTLRQLMDTRYQQTLGKLVHTVSADLALSPELENLLARALHERNWLVHRFFRQYAPAAESADLGQMAIAKLREVQQLLAVAAAAVHMEALQRLTAAGVSREQIEEGIQLAVEQHLAEELERV